MIRRVIRPLCALALIGGALSAAACEDQSNSLNPIIPTPIQQTETFAGTLNINGGVTFQFTSNRGAVTATLSAVAPDAATVLGMSLGTWNGITCAATLPNDQAVMGSTIYGTVNTTGLLCVRLYDVGKMADALDFEVKVIHF
jgi:hypothetical protein